MNREEADEITWVFMTQVAPSKIDAPLEDRPFVVWDTESLFVDIKY